MTSITFTQCQAASKSFSALTLCCKEKVHIDRDIENKISAHVGEKPKIPFRDTLCFYFHGIRLNDQKLATCLCMSTEGVNRVISNRVICLKPMGKE